MYDAAWTQRVVSKFRSTIFLLRGRAPLNKIYPHFIQKWREKHPYDPAPALDSEFEEKFWTNCAHILRFSAEISRLGEAWRLVKHTLKENDDSLITMESVYRLSKGLIYRGIENCLDQDLFGGEY